MCQGSASAAPMTDAEKREWRDGFGHWSEWATADLARRLKSDRAALVEALRVVLRASIEYRSAAIASNQPLATLELADLRLWNTCDAARALLARMEADK